VLIALLIQLYDELSEPPLPRRAGHAQMGTQDSLVRRKYLRKHEYFRLNGEQVVPTRHHAQSVTRRPERGATNHRPKTFADPLAARHARRAPTGPDAILSERHGKSRTVATAHANDDRLTLTEELRNEVILQVQDLVAGAGYGNSASPTADLTLSFVDRLIGPSFFGTFRVPGGDSRSSRRRRSNSTISRPTDMHAGSTTANRIGSLVVSSS